MNLLKKIIIIAFIIVISIEIISSSENPKLLRILQEVSQQAEPESFSEDNSNFRLLQSTQENNSTADDLLEVSIYQSNLTQTQRNEYLKWVDFANSMNSNGGQSARLTKYFSPQDPRYYPNIFNYGWPSYTLACVAAVSFIAYIILRFGFKNCLGPKKHITTGYGIFTWILIGIYNLNA